MQGRANFGASDVAVWRPSSSDMERSRLAKAMKQWGFSTLEEFHQASVSNPDWFWPAAAADLGVELSGQRHKVVDEAKGREFSRWFTGQRFNAVWSCVDRHASNIETASRPAVIYEGDSGVRRAITYAQLQEDVERFASALRRLDVGKGDRVSLFMPPIPEAAVAVMGCAKIGAIVVPAFSGYGSEALASRLLASEAKLLITVDSTTRRGKSIAMKETADQAAQSCPALKHILVVSSGERRANIMDGRDFWWDEALEDPANVPVPTEALDPNDPLFIIYTSGTTGAPKGIVHSQLGYLLKAAIDLGYAFDIQEDDTVAWIADMGWNLGPLLIMGGLHLGATLVLVEGVPDYPEPDRMWRIVERHKATFLGLAATAARGLRANTASAQPTADLSSLRAFASTGEAWDEPSWRWLFETVGRSRLPILNYTGGTEVGGGILSGYTISPHTPASFCGPLPGMDVDVFDAEGKPANGIGELVILNTWPGMAHSFWKDDERFLDSYWRQWPGVWVHGDLASIDADGYWHIHGRSDDTLKISGRRVGPAEIESALVAHDGVAEGAVIGVPDEMRGQAIVAFVVAKLGHELDKELLRDAVIARLGKGLAPSVIHVVPALPKTRNGKVLRRGIRARYLGEPVGDLSALDPQTPLECIPNMPA